MLVVLTVIGVYENIAVSCRHVSASEKGDSAGNIISNNTNNNNIYLKLGSITHIEMTVRNLLVGIYQHDPQ